MISHLASLGTNIEFYRPVTLAHLFELRQQYPHPNQLHFIAGNTGEIFDRIVHEHRYPILIHLTQLPELQVLEEQSQGLLIGSCVTLSRLRSYLKQAEEHQALYKILYEQLQFNASRQVQNQATVGGHVLNHSRKHTSDLLPIMYVCQSKLRFIYLLDKNEFDMEMKDLQTTDLTDLLLVSIFIPFGNVDEYLQSYKQAHRRKHDTGIVTCAFRLKFDASGRRIELLNMAFGGFGNGVIFVPENTMKYANSGRLEWTKNEIMENVKDQLLSEIELDQFSEGGQQEYRYVRLFGSIGNMHESRWN